MAIGIEKGSWEQMPVPERRQLAERVEEAMKRQQEQISKAQASAGPLPVIPRRALGTARIRV